ncbi:MAG: hypothetical protein ACOH15_10925 [Acetobacterium sp.]
MKKPVYIIGGNDQVTETAGQNNAVSNLGKIPKAILKDKVQTITTILDNGLCSPFIVQKNIPLRWTITAKNGHINSWNNEISIKDFSVDKKLKAGENIIEFTPTQSDTFNYVCWMGLVISTITVVNDINNFTVKDFDGYANNRGYVSGSSLYHNGGGI